jgi:hypothetical protein
LRERRRRLALIAAAMSAIAVAGAVIIAQVTAAGGATVVDFPVAAFTPVEDSTHNNNGNSVCQNGVFVPSEQGSENKGDLNARKGSFLERVQLPQGVTVRSLTMFVNDNDGDDGAHVFLVRKLVQRGLSPQFKGYQAMASTQSQGAVLNTMRKFTDKSISGARVDNARFFYFLELVNCATVEPFDVQVAYAR